MFMGECFQCFGDEDHYLGKKGTKRVLDQHYRNRVLKLLREGKDKAFIRSYLTICEECYTTNHNGLIVEKEDEYVFKLNIERKQEHSGRVKTVSTVVGKKKRQQTSNQNFKKGY